VMKIKNDRVELSKGSWVYKLLTNMGVYKFDMPKDVCSLALMTGWRIVVLLGLVGIFITGWMALFPATTNPPHPLLIMVVILAFVETLGLIIIGCVSGCMKFYTWFEEYKRTCPKVCWTEEKRDE